MTKPVPLPAVPDRVLALSTPAFPSRIADPLVPSTKLKAALDASIASGPGTSWRTAVTMVSLEAGGTRPVASFRGTEVHFSASLLKVAAMYSAFQLRATLKAIAAELGTSTTHANLLNDVSAYLNPKILAKVATLPQLRGVLPAHALPKYKTLFKVVAAGAGAFTAEFANAFVGSSGHLQKMISVSDNASATECVQASGYGFLNGLLQSAGFFDETTSTGIWLAGDFTGAYPYFRIQSVNDRAVAQATTTLDLARLYTLLHDSKLVPSGTVEMLALLASAVAVPEVFINRASALDFTVTHTKVGLGPLKTGSDVWSEGSILRHDPSGREFVAVWQNFVFGSAGFDPIGHVVRDTIHRYLAP